MSRRRDFAIHFDNILFVNITDIAVGRNENRQILLTTSRIESALLGNDLQMRLVNILCHSRCITSDVEVPAPLEHWVLSRHLCIAIAAKGSVKSIQHSSPNIVFQLRPVEQVGRFVLVAEEKPIESTCLALVTLLQEREKWCDSGAWLDHDHRDVQILRNRKTTMIGLDKNPHLITLRDAVGQHGT